MLTSIKKRLLSLFQLLLVILYILFEELIWEGIAKPIYEAIHSLQILQRIEDRLERVNASIVLTIFIVLLVIVEVLGLYAGVLFVSGQVVLGVVLYISKIPVAAFTFWLFRVTEDKLMEFGWFKWLYEKLLGAISWLKSRKIYHDTMRRLAQIKGSLKGWFASIKTRYFSKSGGSLERLKALYRRIKASLKR
jgi:membrane-bound ClpP family serine protease